MDVWYSGALFQFLYWYTLELCSLLVMGESRGQDLAAVWCIISKGACLQAVCIYDHHHKVLRVGNLIYFNSSFRFGVCHGH